MQIREMMSSQVATCNRNTSLQDVATLMIDNDCGMIPVVEENGSPKPIGTVTDRDIVIRSIAKGKNPIELSAGDIMSQQPVTIRQDASDDEAEELMAQHQIRRLIVVDGSGDCAGVLAQADLARKEPESETGRVVKKISQPTDRKRS